MSIKKMSTILLVAITCSVGIAVAKKCDDFSQEDFNRILKGEKDFIGAKLEEANLKGMNLSGADFRGAELEKANMQNTNLSNSNLKNADLEKANLKGANINGPNFSGAELEYATWIDGRVCGEGSVGGCW